MKALLYMTVLIYVIVEISSQKFSKPDIDKCVPSPEIHKCRRGIYTPESCCKNIKIYYKLRMPNPDDCSSYYQCSNSRSVAMKCPKGLQWSIETERCEWPEEANCVAHNSSEDEGSDENGDNEADSNEGNIWQNNGSDESGEVNSKKRKRNDNNKSSESKELKRAVEMALKMIHK